MYIPMLDPVAVGRAVAFYRNQKGISQEVLSGLADIGRSHLSAIERGERKPTLETLYRISRALDIKMSTIIIKLEEELENNEKCNDFTLFCFYNISHRFENASVYRFGNEYPGSPE